MRRTMYIAFPAGTALLFLAFAGVGVNGTLVILLGTLLAILILMHPLFGLALTIVTNVLSPLLGSFDFSGLGLTLPRAFGAITFVSWITWILMTRRTLPPNRQLIPLGLFLAVMMTSVLLRPDHVQSAIGTYMVIVGVIFYLAIAALAATMRQIVFIALVVSVMGVLSASIGIVQYVAPGLEVLQNTEGGLDVAEGAVVDADSVASGAIKRVTGGLGDPNQFAYTLVAILPLAVFWWNYRAARRYRGLVVGLGVIGLAGLTLSFSRSGFAALGAAIAYLVWKRRISVPAVCAGAAVCIVAGFLFLPAGFWERTFSVQYLQNGSTNIRKDLTLDIIRIVRQHPIFGIGYGQLGPELYGHPQSPSAAAIAPYVDLQSKEVHNTGAHNLALEVLVEYGIVGLAPYSLFIFFVVRELSRCVRNTDPAVRELAIAVMAGLIAFLVCGIFGHEKALKVFWLLAGLALSLRRFLPARETMDAPAALTTGQAA